MDPPFDPADHTVSELRETIEGVDDPEALEALLEAERAGDDRTTAVEAIEERLEALGGAQSPTPSEGGASISVDAPTDAEPVRDTLEAALRYPWNGGQAAVTLVVGGILTLLTPLVVPGLIVIGYGLKVVETSLEGRDDPPGFAAWPEQLADGIRGTVVLIVYVFVPLGIGAGVVIGLADAAIVSVSSGTLFRLDPATGLIAFLLALALAGLALVVSYLAPAALVHLGRTGRVRSAFAIGDVRDLARNSEYAATWLLALVVFVGAALVLAVLNAAAIGVIVSGFVTFYAFVAMARLYARGAAGVGVDLES